MNPEQQYCEICIELKSPAFAEKPSAELARILRELADRLEFQGGKTLLEGASVCDRNGVVVGGICFYT